MREYEDYGKTRVFRLSYCRQKRSLLKKAEKPLHEYRGFAPRHINHSPLQDVINRIFVDGRVVESGALQAKDEIFIPSLTGEDFP